MGILYDLSTKYKTISIVGMAKNAGKTTALNYLIEEAIDEGVVLGITSTGRDGRDAGPCYRNGKTESLSGRRDVGCGAGAFIRACGCRS